MRYEHTEAMEEIMANYGVTVTREVVEKIAADFADHISAWNSMDAIQYMGGHSECSDCKKKDAIIQELETENSIYAENVKKRHGAVRAYVNKTSGEVLYDLR